jgi:subfamily B ATP-binding cassette protein MsbA
MQRPYIFNLSLKDNIILDQEYEANKYKDIIKKLNMNKTFSERALNNDDLLLENGESLSGGQIKLLALARACYRECDILLIDEVSANLDNKFIEDVRLLVNWIKRDKIVLLIDHTSAFDELVDEVIEMY